MTASDADDEHFLGGFLDDVSRALVAPDRVVTLWGGPHDGEIRVLPRNQWQYGAYRFTGVEDVRRGTMRIRLR